MSPAESATPVSLHYAEWGLVLLGLWFLWSDYLAPKARALALPALRAWDIEGYQAAFALLRVVLMAFATQTLVTAVIAKASPGMSFKSGIGMLIAGGAFQVGMLLGVGLAWYFLKRVERPWAPWLQEEAPKTAEPVRGVWPVLVAGVRTFLSVLAIVQLLSLAWGYLLDRFGAPAPEQEMVTLLKNSDSLLEQAAMILLAVVVAPIAEEPLFRGGFFRYLRTRISRPLAFLLPALAFSALHGNLQAFPSLLGLALFFSLVFERKGNLWITILAHGLFNLHTIVLIYLGFNAT